MRLPYATLALYLLLSCQAGTQESTSTADSTAMEGADSIDANGQQQATALEPVVPEQHKGRWSIDQTYEKWVGDSLITILRRKTAIEGELLDVSLVSDHFLDASNPSHPRELLAVLVQSGEGEYSGMRTWPGGTAIPYTNVYSILAVYESAADGFVLIVEQDLGVANNAGLVATSVDAETIKLRNNQYGALVHFRSSEDGAGDSGYNKDYAYIYVLVDRSINLVLEFSISEDGFASDETSFGDTYSTTTEYTLLESSTGGLFDIRVVTTSTASYEVDASEAGDSTGAASYDNSDSKSDKIYKWSGSDYTCAAGCDE